MLEPVIIAILPAWKSLISVYSLSIWVSITFLIQLSTIVQVPSPHLRRGMISVYSCPSLHFLRLVGYVVRQPFLEPFTVGGGWQSINYFFRITHCHPNPNYLRQKATYRS